MIKGAIFDVDGTLLDSMGIWKDVGVRYLNSIGIEAEPDLGNILFTMSIQEGAQYVKEHYHLSQETDEIEQNVLDIISDYYKMCIRDREWRAADTGMVDRRDRKDARCDSGR